MKHLFLIIIILILILIIVYFYFTKENLQVLTFCETLYKDMPQGCVNKYVYQNMSYNRDYYADGGWIYTIKIFTFFLILFLISFFSKNIFFYYI
jgi:hypothetical protein